MAKKDKDATPEKIDSNASQAEPNTENLTDNEPESVSEGNEGFEYIQNLDAVDLPSDDETTDGYNFEPIDVSEPRAPRKELDILEEELAQRRRTWVREHSIFIYAGIGAVLVLIVFFIMFQNYRTTNPTSRFYNMFAKVFNTSFTFDIELSENGETVESYNGYFDINRSTHEIRSTYTATHTDYEYEGALYSDGSKAYRGNYYDGNWTVRDCTEMMSDFFDFDTDFARGSFDAGAALRFLGLNSDYSSWELTSYLEDVGQKLTTDSSVATVHTESKDDGSKEYRYEINVYTILQDIAENGASIFYRSSDYDQFKERFALNEETIKTSSALLTYAENSNGYATDLTLSITVDGNEYAMSCHLSDIGESKAKIDIPTDFFKAAGITETES